MSRSGRLDSIAQDIRFGVRTLLRRPAFTLLALATLAIGIGANAAIFSVIDAVLLAPLPYPEGGRLVTLWEVGEEGGQMHVAAPNFHDWRAQARSFTGMATHPSYRFGGPTTVLGGEEPVRVWTAYVSGDFFRVMGVAPALGRAFGPDEVLPGGAPLAVVSHAFWRDQLGGRSTLDGVVLRVGSATVPVLGVMPSGFRYPADSDIWVSDPVEQGDSRTSHNYAVTARLLPGVDIAGAQREMSAIAGRIRAQYGEQASAVDVRVTPLHDELVDSARQPLLLLLGAAGLVLLIACTNLASALLARAGARRVEFAIRSSLGAGRVRLVRQLFTESLLLSVAGAAAGVLLAGAIVRAFTAVGPTLARGDAAVGVDTRVLLFSAALALLSAVLFGLIPALRVAEGTAAGVLREGGRGAAGGRTRMWNALVAAEVALALVLLVASGLLIRSFSRILAVDPGFTSDGVLTVDLELPTALYPTDAAVAQYHVALLEELRAVPGVDAAGLINHLPLAGVRINGGLDIDGLPDAAAYADYRAASAGYFDALGIRVVRGRGFDETDRSGGPHAAVVNEQFVSRFLAGRDPIGTVLRNLSNDSFRYGDAPLTIVGVVADVRHGGLLAAPAPEVYVNAAQRGFRARSATVVLRSRDISPALVATVRDRIRARDASVPMEFRTMRERVDGSLADRRFALLVLGSFAAIALVLAGVGIYGVVSYSVERRRREMGVRLALGAAPASVRGLVVRDAMRIVAAGLAVGIVGAAAASRLLRSMLFDVSAADPLTFVTVVAILAGVALLACWIPALRTTRVDPLLALRSE
jgi:predicted permease